MDTRLKNSRQKILDFFEYGIKLSKECQELIAMQNSSLPVELYTTSCCEIERQNKLKELGEHIKKVDLFISKAKLTTLMREVMIMRYVQFLTYEKISKILFFSIRWVHHTKNKAIDLMVESDYFPDLSA